jgi:hypothetical protein
VKGNTSIIKSQKSGSRALVRSVAHDRRAWLLASCNRSGKTFPYLKPLNHLYSLQDRDVLAASLVRGWPHSRPQRQKCHCDGSSQGSMEKLSPQRGILNALHGHRSDTLRLSPIWSSTGLNPADDVWQAEVSCSFANPGSNCAPSARSGPLRTVDIQRHWSTI